MDTKRLEERIYTFARICVEVDLSRGLPDQIQLKHRQRCWTQFSDYENTAFRCRTCQQIGHLQNTCPTTKKDIRRKKKIGKQGKRWKFPPPLSDEEEEEDVEHVIPNENNQMNKEPEAEDINPQESMDSLPVKIPKTMDISESKRQHISDTSDSNKNNPQPMADTSLALVSSLPTQGSGERLR